MRINIAFRSRLRIQYIFNANMLSHYFKLAFRHLVYRKKYTLINIIGLAVGFTVVILIAIYVRRELSYDMFHTDAENIYFLEEQMPSENSGTGNYRTFSLHQAGLISDKVLEIRQITELNFKVINEYNPFTFSWKNQYYKINDIVFCDSLFPKVFDFKLIGGNWKKALSEVNSIILTQSLARQVFGGKDPLSKVIRVKNSSFTVNGVIEDPPDN